MKAKVKKSQAVRIPNCSLIWRKLAACKKSLTKKEMEAMNGFYLLFEYKRCLQALEY